MILAILSITFIITTVLKDRKDYFDHYSNK